MSGFHPFGSPQSGGKEASPRPGLLGPIPNGLRRVSCENVPTPSSATPNDTSSSPAACVSSPGLDVDSPAGTSVWSSAIGHATTAGKSGRVIERLMAENDKLKRELELQVLRLQELERATQAYKPQMEAMQEKIDSLSHVRDMDNSILQRRDRKIEELKADLAQERESKAVLQKRVREAEQERDETVDRKKREVQGLAESTKHATVHAEILEMSHKQLSAEYRTRYATLGKSFYALQDEREQNRQKLARLDVVCEQMRSEHERSRRLQSDLIAKWEECERSMSHTMHEANHSNETIRKASSEMDKVVDEMRWLMGVKRNAHARSDAEIEAVGSKPFSAP